MNRQIFLFLLVCSIVLLMGCKPEANWTDKDVDITITVENVSASFIECSFSTTKDAYYLIAIEQVREDFNPMDQQKQFMTMALDSANLDYLFWRNTLLRQGEFNIAPFASHSLQYGTVNHIFTRLAFDTDYWIYAFVVNPETLAPVGKLHLLTVHTTQRGTVNVRFDYRVKGNWDYIYPMDTVGNIIPYFPYFATTRDSLEIAESVYETAEEYFVAFFIEQYLNLGSANILYGVHVTENDGYGSHLAFEPGHTYYTGMGTIDGDLRQCALYRFVWQGESTDLYFRDEYPTNRLRNYFEP